MSASDGAKQAITDKSLDLAIEEMRHSNDWLNAAYDKVKTKALAFFGGGLAVLTYLYAGGSDGVTLFAPREVYGMIFYCLGLALMMSALVLLFLVLLPRGWELPTESAKIKRMNFESDFEFKTYVKNRHVFTWKVNVVVYAKVHKLLNMAFYPLVFGAIMLIVIKIFQ